MTQLYPGIILDMASAIEMRRYNVMSVIFDDKE